MYTYIPFVDVLCFTKSTATDTRNTCKKKQQVWSISFLIQQSVMQAYKITNSPTHSLPAKSTSCSLVQKFDFFDPGTTLLDAEPEYVGS